MKIILAENLRMLRQREGYSQEAVAELLDVSRQAVAKWEMGESFPDLPNTVKLATLFRVSLDELVLQSMKESQPGNRDKVMGVLEVSTSGQIHLPDEVMSLFDIHSGENVLLLADKEQGIAILKCRQFERKEDSYGDKDRTSGA